MTSPTKGELILKRRDKAGTHCIHTWPTGYQELTFSNVLQADKFAADNQLAFSAASDYVNAGKGG